MSAFAPVTTTPIAAPDPAKHVNYTLGMVLGVDDFVQEFAYHAGRGRRLTRELIGYGTVCGLQVSIATDRTPFEVVISAGEAVTPPGQIVRVPLAQCAKLNDWLAANQTDLLSRLGSPPTPSVRLYVLLSYRDCPTDAVPIPGEPCRSADEAMAPSRLTDDFRLELAFDPPDQPEEDGARAFLAALSQMEVANTSGPFVSLNAFLTAIRTIVPPSMTSPLSSPLGSALAGLMIQPAAAAEFFRAALRVWVTELRPLWLAQGLAADGSGPSEDRLLLAELDVPLTKTGPGGTWTATTPSAIAIHEEQRPFLVPLRLLQEWMLYLPPGLTTSGSGAVAAAGQFSATGQAAFATPGLTATPLLGAPVPPLFLLEFPGFQTGGRYVVRGSVLADAASTGQTFHVVAPADPVLTKPGTFPPTKSVNSGIVVRSLQTTGAVQKVMGFMVEIAQY
jgi:hypothetical protein